MHKKRDLETASALIEMIASGMSARAACRKVEIDDAEFYRWCAADKEFASNIARAREIGQDASVDEMREIADSATGEDWQVARLKIWQRQWEAAKRAPKRYGDKVEQTQIHEIGDTLKAEISRIREGKLGIL